MTALATRGSAPDNWGWAIVFVAVLALLIYFAMWWGWRRRGRRHDLLPLQVLEDGWFSFGKKANGRYFGSTVHGSWLDRVVAQGLGNRSDVMLLLHDEGLDVHRDGLPSFRIPVDALVGAGTASGIAGKVIPPSGVLLVTWTHGDLTLDSGFRLAEGGHEEWVEAIEKLVKEHSL